MTDSPEEVGKRPPCRNSPKFVCFTDDNAEPTYFVYVEQTVLCQVVKALILWFVSHTHIHTSTHTKIARLLYIIAAF